MNEIMTFSGVSAGYAAVPVIHDITFTLKKGRILGLVGESGSGKSTVARTAAGLLAPMKGSVALDGHALPPVRDRDACRRIQMVFQNAENSLNPRRSAGTILTDAMRFHRIAPKGKIVPLARALLERVGLGPDAFDRLPGSFSGGQKQRVALARALCVGPDVLIADEMTSALDVSVQRMILDLILDIQKEKGLAVLFISHDLGVVRAVSDDVMLIQAGRIVETSPADSFFRQPQTDYGRTLLDAVPRLVYRNVSSNG